MLRSLILVCTLLVSACTSPAWQHQGALQHPGPLGIAYGDGDDAGGSDGGGDGGGSTNDGSV